MNKAQLLIDSLDRLDFEAYIRLSEELTKLSDLNVEKALRDQASIFSFYGGLEVEARKREEEAESELEDFSNTTHTEYKENTSSSVKKPTAKDIESFVQSRPKYIELKKKVREATYKRSLLTKLLRALEQKKDMAVQISAKLRKEMELT